MTGEGVWLCGCGTWLDKAGRDANGTLHDMTAHPETPAVDRGDESTEGALRAALEAIRSEHVAIPDDPSFCRSCTTSWPCVTYRTANHALTTPAPELGRAREAVIEAAREFGAAFIDLCEHYSEQSQVPVQIKTWVRASDTHSALVAALARMDTTTATTEEGRDR